MQAKYFLEMLVEPPNKLKLYLKMQKSKIDVIYTDLVEWMQLLFSMKQKQYLVTETSGILSTPMSWPLSCIIWNDSVVL